MKSFGLAVAFASLAGCTSAQVGTSSASAAATSAGASSSGTASGGGTSTGTASGGSATGGSSTGSASSGTTTGQACTPLCGANESCISGLCKCDPGFFPCADADGGLLCTDEKADQANCGSCGHACPDFANCADSACYCDGGTSPCVNEGGLVCIAAATDPLNCGGCDNVCASGACVDAGCVCTGGQTFCGPMDGGSCINPAQDKQNCGACGNDCDTDYAAGSGCRFGICSCSLPDRLCANVPSTSPPTCACAAPQQLCSTPSFATDIYPLLAEQTGAFGCSASGCHSGATPAGGLAFLDASGNEDAGMAYAELLLGGGSAPDGGATCDAGVPFGAASTECICVSRVVPDDSPDSFLIDVLSNDPPANCGTFSGMPIDSDGGWAPLSACALELIEQWVGSGAGP